MTPARIVATLALVAAVLAMLAVTLKFLATGDLDWPILLATALVLPVVGSLWRRRMRRTRTE